MEMQPHKFLSFYCHHLNKTSHFVLFYVEFKVESKTYLIMVKLSNLIC